MLAAQGRAVALCAYSRVDAAEAIATEIRESGVRAEVFQADLTQRDEAVRLVEQVLTSLGDLEVLVGNAGIDVISPTNTAAYDDELWDRMLAIHLTAPFVMARAAIPHFLERGSGVIINVASIAGKAAWPGNCGYNAAKAGMINLTRTIATEYATQGIRANTVCPGIIATRMSWDYINAAEDPAEAERIANAAQPMGRMGTAEEVASVIAFLASPAASYVTGTEFVADGGYLAV
jgi:NAD(P)-dependent dehydrogenase (short-subunit alcohol dehydrogenase family)